MEILKNIWSLCVMQTKSEIEKEFINQFDEFVNEWASVKWTWKKWGY